VLFSLPLLTWGRSSGFQGSPGEGETRSTEAIAFEAPVRNLWPGTIIATIPVGRIPVRVTPNSANGYVYVANYGSSNVSVINGTKLVATVRVGDGSGAVAYNRGNGYVYVANKLSNNVSVVNGTKVVATIPVGPYPTAVGYDTGNGYVYVADQANNVSVINGTKVVATILVGNFPFAVMYDSGNGYVYVANKLSNNVSVINGTKVVATIPVGSWPNAMGYNPGNGFVYVANEVSASVSVINGTKVLATVPGGYGPNDIGYDNENGCVYVANYGSNNVSVIKGTAVVATVGVGNGPSSVAYDDGGDGNVYVTNRASGTVSVIGNATVVATLTVGTSPGGVAHTRGSGYVYVANADSSTVSVIAPPPPAPPIVSVDVTGIRGTADWFRSPATVVISATDYGSGVKAITYKVGGGAWQVYASGLTFSDGTYFISYTATDWAGKTAPVSTLVLRVDSVPPRLRAVVNGTKGAGGWFTSLPSISLSASDNGSGVQRIAFQLDGAAAQNYSVPIILSDGVHLINATATDAAGNVAWSLIEARVDTTPPVLQLKPLPGPVTTRIVTVSWTGTDNASGISGYEVSVDGGARQGVGRNTSLTTSLPDGAHTITVWAIDAVGNTVSHSLTFLVDTNVFSPNGPYAGAPTYGLILAAVATAGFVLWRRWRRSRRPPGSLP
jgi:YVTN family beta-propeller protein